MTFGDPVVQYISNNLCQKISLPSSKSYIVKQNISHIRKHMFRLTEKHISKIYYQHDYFYFVNFQNNFGACHKIGITTLMRKPMTIKKIGMYGIPSLTHLSKGINTIFS